MCEGRGKQGLFFSRWYATRVKQTTEHSEGSCSSRYYSYLYTAPNAARFPSLAVASFEIIQIRKYFKPWPWWRWTQTQNGVNILNPRFERSEHDPTTSVPGLTTIGRTYSRIEVINITNHLFGYVFVYFKHIIYNLPRWRSAFIPVLRRLMYKLRTSQDLITSPEILLQDFSKSFECRPARWLEKAWG
jgi:hypothetical protein